MKRKKTFPATRPVAILLVLVATLVTQTSALSATRMAERMTLHATRHTALDQSDWLGEINRYRTAAGLPMVTNNASWDAGIADHLTYLEETPASYFTGAYQSLHTENPASPYYTQAGAQEGASSDLVFGYGTASPVQMIDVWLAAPFHAVGILRATLGQVAFVSQGGDAGLDVISGLGENPAATSPILFPGPGMTTNLTQYAGGELPTPLTTCGWTGASSVGLPLIALLPQSPSAGLTATLTSTAGAPETSANGNLCVVDENDFVSTDPVYGPTGAEILAGDNAVFLIPQTPLSSGAYTATISQPGAPDITWSFNVVHPVISASTLPSTVDNVASYSTTLMATGGQAPYTWSFDNGVLPPGFTLSSSGVITGDPKQWGRRGVGDSR